ncbi:DUF1837 domain-containing protein [Elizabethkingia anophelis]|uniref:HamA C-terminal domain-containing protein n=1 Tax=Elizabethkingia anophelis TaxID=1117645 RepID=UPI00099A36EE|nr:DUF1837 domain-containing protein [Elizabethkingia anophelis]MDV4129802.1 DUF1837 domain-containing protein [Elizabethkingia anophelis]MDV4133490.1 DUF1837 domain-containing protein [Elizabethkingia anophelis]OPC55977.1 hypothetical protein BAY08_04245 [Elizabethkingia anophelis]
MDLKSTIDESFLELFYKEIECDVPDTHSKLNLHILKIENNQFCYPELVNHLRNHFISFSLSRKEIQDFEKDKRYGELYTKAASKFRDYNVNDGEAGELLLFCFLESHLKAPKILTKLEIKLSSKDYAKGSDGVHLLKIADRDYQLIFGESKLYQNLTTSITKAFESIHDFTTRSKSNINDEIGLLNSQLCKETFDEDLYQFLKSVIMPKANADEPITKNNAFAIFAGFEINPTDEEKKLSNSDFLKTIKEQIKKEVEGKMEHLKKKIEEYSLHGYTFYVYVFPFMKLDETRKDIIKKITLAE